MTNRGNSASRIRAFVEGHLKEEIRTLTAYSDEIPVFIEAVQRMRQCFQDGGKLLFCGNGGSISSGSHVCNDFIMRMNAVVDLQMPAITLGDNPAAITAIANDCGFEYVYSKQVESLGKPEDVLVGLSSSGNSPNIIRAAEAAKAKGITVIGLTGDTGGKLRQMADIWVRVPSGQKQVVEDVHMILLHALALAVVKQEAENATI